MLKTLAKMALNQFERRYSYDTTYLKEVLQHSPAGFRKFYKFTGLAQHRKAASTDAYWIAKLVATRSEDCGPCLELNTKMAKEAGVSEAVIRAALDPTIPLSKPLDLVRQYAGLVRSQSPVTRELVDELRQAFGPTAQVELALCLASARVYPSLKRALGHGKSCSLPA